MMRSSRKQDSFWKRALGIASANFFTARYLTPLANSGYIAVAGGEKNRYLPGKQYRIFGTTANCRKRRSIDLRFLRYEGLTAVA